MNESESLSYSAHEAAKVLGTSESAVRAMILRKQIPVVRIGHRVFILRDELERWLKSQGVVDSTKR